VNILSKSKKRSTLASLDELAEQMPSLLQIDHPCAQRHIADARYMVEVCKMLCIVYLPTPLFCLSYCFQIIINTEKEQSCLLCLGP